MKKNTAIWISIVLIFAIVIFAEMRTHSHISTAPVGQQVQTASSTSGTATSTATLIVSGQSFALTAPAGSTVKEAMDELQSEGSFSYTYKEYSGLGDLVTSVQGTPATNDAFWILYVNGEEASTGITATKIQRGDVIEWKLEKNTAQ